MLLAWYPKNILSWETHDEKRERAVWTAECAEIEHETEDKELGMSDSKSTRAS